MPIKTKKEFIFTFFLFQFLIIYKIYVNAYHSGFMEYFQQKIKMACMGIAHRRPLLYTISSSTDSPHVNSNLRIVGDFTIIWVSNIAIRLSTSIFISIFKDIDDIFQLMFLNLEFIIPMKNFALALLQFLTYIDGFFNKIGNEFFEAYPVLTREFYYAELLHIINGDLQQNFMEFFFSQLSSLHGHAYHIPYNMLTTIL